MANTEEVRLGMESLYAAWLHAESRAREAPIGSLEAADRLADADQLWHTYEDAFYAVISARHDGFAATLRRALRAVSSRGRLAARQPGQDEPG